MMCLIPVQDMAVWMLSFNFQKHYYQQGLKKLQVDWAATGL